MPRSFPALDVFWPLRPDDDRIDVLIAEVDDEGPTAIEERPGGLRMFFADSVARGRAAVRLVALEPDLVCTPVEVSDDDWAERSQASLGPVQVGRFTIAPPWAINADARSDLIVIQPSMGFGTGHHASTRLCLRLLQEGSLAGAEVLDVGTGSGVLAIAAAKLGAAGVLAVDHDPDALMSARENVALNDVGSTVRIEQVDLTDPQTPSLTPQAFDLILANLTGATLRAHVDGLTSLLRAGGRIIASGFGLDETEGVEAAFAAAALRLTARVEEDGWAAVECLRP
jgi:ribosomal protein L11 methyltransferase